MVNAKLPWLETRSETLVGGKGLVASFGCVKVALVAFSTRITMNNLFLASSKVNRFFSGPDS